MRGQDLSAATGYTTQRSSILPLYEVSDPVYGGVLSQNKMQRNILNVTDCANFGQFLVFALKRELLANNVKKELI